jgi:hypothetical protein
MLAIEGWGSSNCIQSVMQKIGKDNKKTKKIGQVISQTFAPKPEHDKIQTRWALDVLSKNMLKRV